MQFDVDNIFVRVTSLVSACISETNGSIEKSYSNKCFLGSFKLVE